MSFKVGVRALILVCGQRQIQEIFQVQVKTWLSMSSLASAVMLLVSAPALADEAALQRQIEAQQRALASQQNQIYQLQNDIATLRGELEQLRYLSSRQGGSTSSGTSSSGSTIVSLPMGNVAANNNASSASTGAKGGAGAGPVTPMGNDNLAAHNAGPTTNNNNAASSQGSSVTLKGVDAKAKAAYESAYAKVQQNDLQGAQTAFKNYLDTYPDNALTPNAWYWLGQVQYSQASYEQARLSFLNVARYSDSQKRPDSLYKLGMISKFLGDTDKAVRYYQLVIQSYPNDAAATLASRELQRLQN